MSIVCLRIEDRFYIRISIVVIVSRNFFIYLFICFPQNAKQPVSKTPLASFQNGKEFGLTTGMTAPVREATQSPSKLKKNGSLSIKRLKTWQLEYQFVAHWFREERRVWTWVSGEQLNILKWRDSQPNSNDKWAEISKNGGLFNVISTPRRNAYICETPGGKITFQP